MSELAERVRTGERAAIARALTVVERKDAAAAALVRELWPHTGRARRIGVTGAPGVGKSTLVDALATGLADTGKKVGVLAVDPTSPFTHGALLGDRIRMQKIAGRDDVFVRSAASRGRAGGLSPATGEAADVFDAAGFGYVLIETVGVGQGEWEVLHETELVIVVLAPGAGDGIQALKAGLMEIADLFVINKADQPGADLLKVEVEQALSMRTAEKIPPVHTVGALTGLGIGELVSAIATAPPEADLAERRKKSVIHRMLQETADLARAFVERRLGEDPALAGEAVEKRSTPADLAARILQTYRGTSS